MKNRFSLFAIVLFTILCGDRVYAQLSPAVVEAALLPANPTSTDNLKLSMKRTCSSDFPYKANSYLVSMAQNNITIKRGDVLPQINVCPGLISPREEFDLGRLPAGDYTVTMIDSANTSFPNRVLIDHSTFTVTDARVAKTAPYVRLDYSGHWWDPNDSGWGLFIWHDARDNLLAAWFTYAADGKPIWYTFQPKWQTSSATFETALLQTSRAPGATVPPPNPTAFVVAGAVSLDFTNFGTADEGKLIYTLTGGAKQVRNIQRFKP